MRIGISQNYQLSTLPHALSNRLDTTTNHSDTPVSGFQHNKVVLGHFAIDINEKKTKVILIVKQTRTFKYLSVASRIWPNMINVKSPHLADLEIESLKKFILDYERHSQ